MAKYPVSKLVPPRELAQYKNGRIPAHAMREITSGGQMFWRAAIAYNLMWDAAKRSGIILDCSSNPYRTFDQQLELFNRRFAKTKTGRKPVITRTYLGHIWWLKAGYAPCAAPGESDHGWGLAFDVDTTIPGAFEWLCIHAPKWGFTLQSGPRTRWGRRNPNYEPWHWQYVMGDKFTTRVANRLKAAYG